MGSYAALSIGGYELLQSKGYADPVAMSVFTERDRVALLIPGNGGDRARAQPIPPNWTRDDLVELADDVRVDIRYRASSASVAERLEVMGVSLAKVRKAFEMTLRERADEIAESMDDDGVSRAALAQMLRTATFLDWSSAFGEFMASDIHPGWPFTAPEALRTEMMRFIEEEADDTFFGLPGDARWLLRAATEVCGPDAVVEYDISELVRSGYYELQDAVAARAIEGLRNSARDNAPVLVLTEGSTDATALSRALRLLSPHLVGYLTFPDFHSSNAAGGTGSLVATVRSFAAAGVVNRAVALFDNDAAGRDAIRMLGRTSLPSSLRIAALPDLQLARAYPTRGPSGPAIQDVNGLAASVELYFGDDVLRDQPDGQLMPVVWQAFDRGVGGWQGALEDKAALQARFASKLDRTSRDPALLQSLDWSGMRRIIDLIVHAFDQPEGAMQSDGGAAVASGSP
ncbi:MAG TPA: HEPN/Toprim-associated domain-containing protein [Galbitalea sp.]